MPSTWGQGLLTPSVPCLTIALYGRKQYGNSRPSWFLIVFSAMQSTAKLLCHLALAVLISQVKKRRRETGGEEGDGGEKAFMDLPWSRYHSRCAWWVMWQQQCEVSSHTKSPVRKSGGGVFQWSAHLFLPIQSGTTACVCSVHICGEGVFPLWLIHSRNAITNMPTDLPPRWV